MLELSRAFSYVTDRAVLSTFVWYGMKVGVYLVRVRYCFSIEFANFPLKWSPVDHSSLEVSSIDPSWPLSLEKESGNLYKNKLVITEGSLNPSKPDFLRLVFISWLLHTLLFLPIFTPKPGLGLARLKEMYECSSKERSSSRAKDSSQESQRKGPTEQRLRRARA